MQPDQPTDPAVRDLLYQIKFGSNAQRNEAINSAALLGTKAVAHLAQLMMEWRTPGQFRGAQEAIRRIVLNAYRANGEGAAATGELVKLIGPTNSENVRREALYLIGFSTESAAVQNIAALLDDRTLREDARMALERMPAREAESALRSAQRSSQGDWRSALEYSLRKRRMSLQNVGISR